MVLQGIMLKADTPHDSPNSPAPNIVVLGNFLLPTTNDSLHFSVDFFESKAMQESIEITASKKSEGLKQVFEISSKTPSSELKLY